MVLLSAGASIYGLQRLLYGPLRAIEIEQLWDKAWYAITETALAMTTFRDEVGGWFFIMFMSLLAGKVWGWIGEGRVETLEQQPPANPRLFHARLLTSLLLSEAFDIVMLRYCVRTLLDDARPGMMVMFAFEFAVLAISSSSTTARYGLTLQEKAIIKRQTKAKVEERREEIRAARQEAEREAASQGSDAANSDAVGRPQEEEVDENEIDVPGWQEKGRYILFLDLTTGAYICHMKSDLRLTFHSDFLKLVLYLGFFMILLFFSGIPIHMFRDLFVTTRSFLKRINDYLKYRNATRDMNARYPDATPEELERDGTCIICREEMRPWQHLEPTAGAAPRAQRSPPDERQRPKKLPCGHILHFGCLRSWLERQQVCPTCRRSVLVPNPSRDGSSAPGGGGPGNEGNAAPAGQAQGGEHRQQQNHGHQRNQGQRGIRGRTFNLPGIRLTFATGTNQQFRDLVQQRNQPGGQGQFRSEAQRIQESLDAILQGRSRNNTSSDQDSLHNQIQGIERQIMQEINSLGVAQEQLVRVRALQGELARLRITNANGQPPNAAAPANQQQQGTPVNLAAGFPQLGPAMPQFQPVPPIYNYQQTLTSLPQHGPVGPEHPDLPSGMNLPQGWSLLPLQRIPEEHYHSLQTPSDESADPTVVVEQAPLPPAEAPQPDGMSPQDRDSVSHNSPTQQGFLHPVHREPSIANVPRSAENGFDQVQPSPNHQPSYGAAPPSMPDWSSQPSGASRLVDHEGAASAEEHRPLKMREEDTGLGIMSGNGALNGSTETRKGKGKGRVATVEDSDEAA